MKKILLGLLVILGFSTISLANGEFSSVAESENTDESTQITPMTDEDIDLNEPRDDDDRYRRYGGVWCIARDRRGNTYRGFANNMGQARREALSRCLRSSWPYRDRNDRWDRDHRRHGCYIVRCSRRGGGW